MRKSTKIKTELLLKLYHNKILFKSIISYLCFLSLSLVTTYSIIIHINK